MTQQLRRTHVATTLESCFIDFIFIYGDCTIMSRSDQRYSSNRISCFNLVLVIIIGITVSASRMNFDTHLAFVSFALYIYQWQRAQSPTLSKLTIRSIVIHSADFGLSSFRLTIKAIYQSPSATIRLRLIHCSLVHDTPATACLRQYGAYNYRPLSMQFTLTAIPPPPPTCILRVIHPPRWRG